MVSSDNLRAIVKRYSDSIGIVPQYIKPVHPIGQAGDRYLAKSIDLCIQDPSGVVSYLVPCIRHEQTSDLADGSHLSLFYLYMFIFGTDVNPCLINDVFMKITGVASIRVESLHQRTDASFSLDNYRFVNKIIEPAKGFPYSNLAYEMFDSQGVEIGNISRFVHVNEIDYAYVLAFGLERLIMHEERKINIWDTNPFKLAKSKHSDLVYLDQGRLKSFLQSIDGASCCDNLSVYASTLLDGR